MDAPQEQKTTETPIEIRLERLIENVRQLNEQFNDIAPQLQAPAPTPRKRGRPKLDLTGELLREHIRDRNRLSARKYREKHKEEIKERKIRYAEQKLARLAELERLANIIKLDHDYI